MKKDKKNIVLELLISCKPFFPPVPSAPASLRTTLKSGITRSRDRAVRSPGVVLRCRPWRSFCCRTPTLNSFSELMLQTHSLWSSATTRSSSTAKALTSTATSSEEQTHPSYQPDYPSNAERRLLANALLDASVQRFVLLSETCIPLFDFSFAYRYLMRSKYSFVEAFDDPGPGARGRYDLKLQPEISIQQWRKGTQWFEMSRHVVVVIVNGTACYTRMSTTCLRSLTWTMWKKDHKGHPATFRKDDMNGTFPEQINRDRNCSCNDRPFAICFLFAGKAIARVGISLSWIC
ncbi:Core-2/I-Branching enzyme [Musa troglodytarum]|uniref:Core-2/I-Branching enzyme n=1 Tax=Musa troglodytarum TaxID=320322 RepID=A0A9E7FM84_9LILI|nr:Core-2/I-Branching enzyme [Musa troglodytarum]